VKQWEGRMKKKNKQLKRQAMGKAGKKKCRSPALYSKFLRFAGSV
jgi:hypothetical protein